MDREPIERLLSKWRVCSRAEAQRRVRAGRVHVRGRAVRDPRALVRRGDLVEVDGRRVGPTDAAHVHLVLNKPRGVVTTTKDPEGRPTVMDLVGERSAPGLAPVGRLDRASAGLLLLTTDHAMADRLLDPRSHVTKRYRVKVRGRVTDEALRGLREDTVREDGLELGPMDVEVASVGPRSTWLDVALREGKNRQVRRRLEALGHEVEVLVRTAFGPLVLGDLRPGAVRDVTCGELERLRGSPRGPSS
jgi:23S rRNA pseudouridine2605 synthase